MKRKLVSFGLGVTRHVIDVTKGKHLSLFQIFWTALPEVILGPILIFYSKYRRSEVDLIVLSVESREVLVSHSFTQWSSHLYTVIKCLLVCVLNFDPFLQSLISNHQLLVITALFAISLSNIALNLIYHLIFILL